MTVAAALPAPPQRSRFMPSQMVLLILPALVLVAFLLVIPYLNIIVMSFRVPATSAPYAPGFTFANYVRALADPFYLAVLWRTLVICSAVTLICFIIGFPVAYHLARTKSRLRVVLYACILSPLLVSTVIRLYGWMIILANNGIINAGLQDWGLISQPLPLMYNELGVIIGLVHVNLPFMVLPLLGALQGVNPVLEEAARSLGARGMTVMRRVIIPLAMPGIQAGVILVFVMAAGSFVTPVMLGGSRVKLMTPMVVQQLTETFLWPLGAALAIVLSVAGGLLILAWMRFTQRRMKGIA